MAKITNEMATKLSLDTTSASKTLKEFTDDVKKSTNEWKVQEAQMRSAGDQLGASKAKYEGLTTAVEKQSAKVESLKQALENTNTSTEKGQKLQGMLTAELAKAERQLNSYNGQLDRAEQSYKYQSSGMAKLNDDIKHNTELTEANVKQLKAEGKEHEANKVKLEGLAKNRESLNGILKIQQAELDKLASSGDKNSEAYKKQELRVAQMKAKIAEANSEIRTMNSHGIKINTSSLDKVNERLAKMNERVNKSGHLFGKVFGANIVSAAFINGLASSKAHLVDALKAGTDFNKEQQVMGATWNTLTGSAEKGQDMVNSINSMSKAFGQSNDVVNELQQQFYHVFNQKEPTEKLTGSMLTLADTLGMNNEEVERLGLNFTHMMSSSRLQLGDFNMISDQLPMYGEKLLEYEKEVQHNSNLTMEQLRKQMSDGKISAQDATNVINELGDKYKDASENMMSTFTGMQRRIKAQSHVLAGSITRPLLETKNPLFKAVSDWVADDRTVKLFDNFGQQLSKTFNTITSAFGKSFKSKDFDEFANNTMVKLTNGVQRFGDYVAKHSDDIINFFKGVKSVGGAGFSTLGVTLKIAMPLLEMIGKFASDHPKAFKALAVSVIGFNVALKGTIGMLMGVSKAKEALIFGKGLFIKPKVDGSSAKRELGIISKSVVGIGKGIKWVAKLAWKGVKKAFGAIKFLAKGIGNAVKWTGKLAWKGVKLALGSIKFLAKGVGKAVSWTAKLAWTGVKQAFKGIVALAKNPDKYIKYVAKMAWNGVKLAFRGIIATAKAIPRLLKWTAKMAWTGVKKTFKLIVASAKGVGRAMKWTAKMAWTGVKKAFKLIVASAKGVGRAMKWTAKMAWTGVKKAFKLIIASAKGVGRAMKWTAKVATGGAKKALSGLLTAAKVTGTGMKAAFSWAKANPLFLIITGITLAVTAFVELYKHNKKFKKFVDGIVKGAKKLFDGVIKWFKKLPKEIGKLFKGVINFFKKDWKEIALFIVNPIGGAIALLYKHFKPFRQFVNGIGKFFKNIFKSMADGVKSAMNNIGKFINSAVKLWQKIFKAELNIISSVFKFIFDGIKVIIQNVMKTIHNIISSVLGTISNVWNSVWNGVSSFFGNIWKGMSKFISNMINGIHNTIKNVLDKIGSTWNGMWKGLSDFFGSIWKDIKGFAQDGINGVLSIINGGIDAIDSVWKFFTGHETSIHHLKPVKFERGGVVETRMSMINDGKGENWKELIQLPDGQLKMSNKRDHVLPLPVGTRVYNGDQTKQIMKAAGVEKYANGGIIGGVVSAAKGATDWTVKTAKGVGEWAGDKYEMVTKFLKDPLKNVTDLIVKGTKGMYDGLHSFGDMAHGVFDNLYNPIADWFKKGLEAIKSSLGRNAPSGSGVERWRDQVKDALKENGMSTESWAVNKILKQISTESSGNEKAVQGGYTDINTKTGDLAKGLMQTISATFNRYAFPGHKNIFNGYDNLLAAIAYIKNRYGMNMSGIGEGHGYANGGLVSRHQIAQIAEGNKPEMIIPLDSMKSSRGFELLGKTAVAMAARDGQSNQNTTDNSEVVGKMDQMITLLSMILGVNKEQLSSGSQNNGLKAIYEQMARDNTMRKYQSI
ncbi:Phage-related protein [Fructobacillus cardui]|uniref:tape measure protein n=1 Tax=Fructobacillus cardui TaxID=2893170 RepID=UPI002D9010BE|nr:Phage-related protein [Fructobacillus cardui]